MTTVLCTLYNSLYLDKGLVLYDSLCECANDFKLYVLCMDDKCYEVLTDLNQLHHIPVKLSDFEKDDDVLLKAKANRSMGEYCWTCSSSFIRYILKHYNEDSCTYIDADMYFYNDPQVLIDEMIQTGKSVLVVPHWFHEGNKYLATKVGEYCVEFNTFLNKLESLEVLDYWRNKCLEKCSNVGDGVHWGDQKYLEELVDMFDCVHVCTNRGAGVAPWNIIEYEEYEDSSKTILLKKEKIRIPMFFYHYQSISYITRSIVGTGLKKSRELDFNMANSLYNGYLKKIDFKKEFLKTDYKINLIITSHPSKKEPSWKRFLKSIKLIRLLSRIINMKSSDYIINLKLGKLSH